MSFIFGGQTGDTAESIRRKRAVADALMAQQGALRNPAEGIRYAGGKIAGALLGRMADRETSEARKEAMARFEGIFSGGETVPRDAAPEAPTRGASPVGRSIYDAITSVESGGDPNAVSPKGATGLMQIMPATARDPGFGVPNIFETARSLGRPVPDESDATLNALLRDGEVNGAMGRAYYDAMLARSGGDRDKALASYNAGPGAVDQYGGIPPFAETQDYVRKVNARMGGQPSAQPAMAQPAPTQQPQSVDAAMLARLAGDEFLPEPQRAVAQAMLARMVTPPEQMSPYQQARLALDERKLAAEMQGLVGRGPVVNVSTGQPQQPMPEIGTIPQGFQAVWDPEAGTYRMAAVPGGPAAAEAESLEAKAEESTAQQTRSAGIVIEDINRLRDRIESAPWYNPAAGMGASIAQRIPGTNAYDANALADTIRANVGFDRLQQMREASPTGGALGAVSEMELRLLNSVLGSLDLAQSEGQLLANLDRLNEVYGGILRKFQAYPNAAEFGIAPAQPAAPAGPGPIRSAGAGAQDPAPEGIDPEDWEFLTPDERAAYREMLRRAQ